MANKKPHAATVRNPSKPLRVAAKAKPTVKANGKNRKRAKAHTRRNPVTVTTTKVRRKVRRNPSTLNSFFMMLLGGLAGGLTLGVTETAINTVLPNAGKGAQVAIPALGAYAVNSIVPVSTPIVGKYKGYIAGLLATFAGLQAWRYYLAPMIASSGFRLPFGISLDVFGQPTATQPATQFVEMPAAKQIALIAPGELAPPQQMDNSDLFAGYNERGEVEWYKN